MLVEIQGSMNDLASSGNRVDGNDEDDEETTQGKLSGDDKPGWVTRTVTKTVQQRIETPGKTTLHDA
jgi:hypothetical protein